jgi:hypothetical protein
VLLNLPDMTHVGRNFVSEPAPIEACTLIQLLRFLIAVTGSFGHFYVQSKLIVSGDAAGTAANIA